MAPYSGDSDGQAREKQARQERLECYRLAVAVMRRVGGPPIRDWSRDLDIWADGFHQRIYGGPMPPVGWHADVSQGSSP